MVELLVMSDSAFSRWLTRFFIVPLLYIYLGAGILTVVGWAIGTFVQFNSTVDFLLWTGPLTVLATSIVVGLFYATLTKSNKVESSPVKAGETIGIGAVARPNIRFMGWKTTEARLTMSDGDKTNSGGSPWLTRVTFVNEPGSSGQGTAAAEVSGHIEFYDASRDQFLFGMVGQWSEDREGEVKVVDSQVDLMPDAKPYYLDLALKYDDDDECYGVNHDTAARAPDDWRDTQRKLDHGLYTVKIMIHGTNITETFWFGLINRGGGQRVRILPINS